MLVRTSLTGDGLGEGAIVGAPIAPRPSGFINVPARVIVCARATTRSSGAVGGIGSEPAANDAGPKLCGSTEMGPDETGWYETGPEPGLEAGADVAAAMPEPARERGAFT